MGKKKQKCCKKYKEGKRCKDCPKRTEQAVRVA
jgi:hypothetical protein